MSLHPEVKWAQRLDKVYVTVQLADAKDVSVKLEPEGVFSFTGAAGSDSRPYEVKIDLNDKVNVETSKINTSVRSIFCVIEKVDKKWWKKLVRDDQKNPHFVKVDWDKWADEDDDGGELDLGGMDFSNFGGMGGSGMENDLDFDDTDDEDDDDEMEKPPNSGTATEGKETSAAAHSDAKMETADGS